MFTHFLPKFIKLRTPMIKNVLVYFYLSVAARDSLTHSRARF